MKPESLAKQFGINKFPFEIKNDKGDLVYSESSNGDIWKFKYNDNGHIIIIWEKSNGDIFEYEYNDKGDLFWMKYPSGYNFELKYKYDNEGKLIEREYPNGDIYTLNENGKWIKQSETLEMTLEQIASNDVPVETLKIKKS